MPRQNFSPDDKRRIHALCERLNDLARRHPQAEMARRTGASRANVNRYLRGTRVPMDFCMALTEALNVNPAWLMTGEGASDLAEINTGTAVLAGDLLELVKAMGAAERLRLGALTGKRHLKVLRELSDAMRSFEDARERLNRHTAPIMAEILEKYGAALKRRDFDQASDLRDALTQVSRLCHDDGLREQFLRMNAFHLMYKGEREAALELGRELFRSVLARSAHLTDALASEADRLAINLFMAGRRWEAGAIADSALALARPGPESEKVLRLRCMRATARERLDEAMPDFSRHYMHMTPAARASATPTYVRMLMYSGTVSFGEAAGMLDPAQSVTARALLPFALWLEDPEAIDLARARYSEEGHKGSPDEFDAHYAGLLAALLRGRKADWREFLEGPIRRQRQAEQTDAVALTASVYAVQLARVAGDLALARHELRYAIRRVDSIDPELSPGELKLAGHYRNVVLLTPPKSRDKAMARARAFFARMAEYGYKAFVPPEADQGRERD